MLKSNAKLLAGAALSALLLAGCGGGDDYVAAGVTPPVAQNQTITNVFAFISNLIEKNGANTDPIDTNVLTLATDDSSEPTPLN